MMASGDDYLARWLFEPSSFDTPAPGIDVS
jgi:hypothetical protein